LKYLFIYLAVNIISFFNCYFYQTQCCLLNLSVSNIAD